MTPVFAVPLLVLAVVILMTLGASVFAFVHGWRDGPSSHENDRHSGLPAVGYGLGWRARRARETADRHSLEEHRADTAAFYRALDQHVRDELEERRP